MELRSGRRSSRRRRRRDTISTRGSQRSTRVADVVDREAGRRLVVGREEQAVQVAAVVGAHDALAGDVERSSRMRLADRRRPRRPSSTRPSGAICRPADRQASETPVTTRCGSRSARRGTRGADHASRPTSAWPGRRTSYWTTPGGVPSVRPRIVSRHDALAVDLQKVRVADRHLERRRCTASSSRR